MSEAHEFASEYERFVVGDTFRFSGLDFRVRRGSKTKPWPHRPDHVIDWRTPSGWVPIGFDAVGLLADFLAWNEEGLYPQSTPGRNFRGGKKVASFISESINHGHQQAIRRLEFEKQNKGDQGDLFRWRDS